VAVAIRTAEDEGKVRMASHKFDPLEFYLQLESDVRLSAARALQFSPAVDMYETKTALIVKMELAGIQPDRLNITLSADDRVLSVAGERREPAEEHEGRIRCYQLEIFFGTFARDIVLPTDMRFNRDNIKANYRDGFLIISLPKRAEKRTIEISNE
jgi:HSP20 family molecular chaperone IbpA